VPLELHYVRVDEDLNSRMPYLVAQFPEFDEATIRDLGRYDPSSQAKFITWILRVLRDTSGLDTFNGERVRGALEQFNRIKNYPDFQGKKDINQYANFDELVYTMDEAAQLKSKKQKQQSIEKITTWKDYTLWLISTPDAAKKFAQHSSLCFCDDPHATNYTVGQAHNPRSGPPLYGVTKGNDKVAALHPNSQQYHDMQNRPLSGDLKRAVLHLCKTSGNPKLLAWYNSKLSEVTAQLQAARQRRAQERRRQTLRSLGENRPTVLLGRYGDFDAVVAQPNAPAVSAHLKEWRRTVDQPVFALRPAEGGPVQIIVDLAAGMAKGADGQPLTDQQAEVVAEALEGYIEDDDRLRGFIRNPREYQERFDSLMANVHTNFVNERVRGYTSPANGIHYPGVSQQEAEARWQAKAAAFAEVFRDGKLLNLDGTPFSRGVPGVSLMKVLERLR